MTVASVAHLPALPYKLYIASSSGNTFGLSVHVSGFTSGWNRRHHPSHLSLRSSLFFPLKEQTSRDSAWDWAQHRLLPILIYPPTSHTTDPGQFRYNKLHRVASNCATSIPSTTFSHATECFLCCISLHTSSVFDVDLFHWGQCTNDSSASGYQVCNHSDVWMELGQHRGGMHQLYWSRRLWLCSR